MLKGLWQRYLEYRAKKQEARVLWYGCEALLQTLTCTHTSIEREYGVSVPGRECKYCATRSNFIDQIRERTGLKNWSPGW